MFDCVLHVEHCVLSNQYRAPGIEYFECWVQTLALVLHIHGRHLQCAGSDPQANRCSGSLLQRSPKTLFFPPGYHYDCLSVNYRHIYGRHLNNMRPNNMVATAPPPPFSLTCIALPSGSSFSIFRLEPVLE